MHKALLLLGCALGASNYETEGNVLKLGASDFDQALTEHPNILVKFFAPWCGHCKNLAQPYSQAADTLHELGSTARLAEVDCTIHKELCQKYSIRGYPTVNWFSQGAEPVKYSSARTKEAIVQWVNEKVPVQKKEQVAAQQQEVAEKEEAVEEVQKKEEEVEKQQQVQQEKGEFAREGKLYKLTTATFAKAKETFDFVFVKFFAPWCGHCVKLAQPWKILAQTNTNEKVAIAEIDCTVQKEVCQQNGIRGYPTLKLFVRGNPQVSYNKARTVEALQQWLQQQTTTLIPGAIPQTKEPEQQAEDL